MSEFDELDRNAEERRAFIRRWAEYVRTHDDEEWARQQRKIVNSRPQSAKELARSGDTDPAEFFRKKDELAGKPGEQDRVLVRITRLFSEVATLR